MVRVRHYTKKSRKEKILEEGVIVARDQNKVFVEEADTDPLSPRDVESSYRLGRGKGNAYVEFDVEDGELEQQKNAITGKIEYFLRGDVSLIDRDAEGFDND